MVDAVALQPQSTPPQSTADLTDAERRLLAICQEIQFGRLLDLHVEDGQPSLDARLTIEREHKYGSGAGRIETAGETFALKAQQRDFIARLRAMEGTLTMKVQVQHGLPFRGTTIETIN